MSKKWKVKLKMGELLCQLTDLTERQLQEALDAQIIDESMSKKALGEILVDLGYVAKADVETALAIQYGYPYLSVANYNVQEDALKLIPKDFALKYEILPLEKKANVLVAAVASPFVCDFSVEVLQRFGYKARIFLGISKQIIDAINKYYG
ncbi:MAG: hypothetical protein KJ893_02210 [Candidatus Omnitrophica bacterium]|nr:hypothetical protein [Candidatus Omnitrophota bacterium]MBU4478901.1 hypothetical protein [Candidatus Omnitrophota bacterium]